MVTRRLRARPSAEPFEAIGAVSPSPRIWSRLAGKSVGAFASSQFFTAFARASERIWFDDGLPFPS